MPQGPGALCRREPSGAPEPGCPGAALKPLRLLHCRPSAEAPVSSGEGCVHKEQQWQRRTRPALCHSVTAYLGEPQVWRSAFVKWKRVSSVSRGDGLGTALSGQHKTTRSSTLGCRTPGTESTSGERGDKVTVVGGVVLREAFAGY